MFSICDHVQTLSIDWIRTGALITALLTLIAFIWSVFSGFNKKVSKKQYYEEIKQIKDEFKELEKKMKGELDCIEQNNTISHTRLSQETERYYEILNSQFNKITDSINTKLDMLLEHALNKKK